MKKYILLLLIVGLHSELYSQPVSAFPKIPFNMHEHPLFVRKTDTSVISNGSWTYLAPLPRALYGAATYYWQDSNKILICGGADTNGVPTTNCYFYNLNTNTYEQKPPLPVGRAFGKLVRIADSLYLVGSINANFHLPDGAVYKFAPFHDTAWIIKAYQPAPALQEMAVCTYHDTAIYTIGGSTDGFTGVTNIVRAYIPYLNTWITEQIGFPQNLATADAECTGEDFLVVGGFDGTVLNTIYHGLFSITGDSLNWELMQDSTAPFQHGVYRVGGGSVNSLMVFGPGLRDTASSGELWGFYPAAGPWVQYLPVTPDTAGDIPTIAIKATSDSLYFYLFGGVLPGINPVRVTDKSMRYAVANPFIGIRGISGEVPGTYRLFQNYPNPFNPVTTIMYEIPKASTVKLTVIDILGREVKTLVNEFKLAGSYRAEFDGTNLSSGIYFCRMTSASRDQYFSDTKKMVLVK